jgi:hypothetical protein
MTEAIRPDDGKVKAGYKLMEHPRHGIIHWEVPPVPNGMYVAAGDPGMGDPPKRNAPVVIVARVDVKPWEIVYFDWIFGQGSYKPFLSSFKYALSLYQPPLRGLDATGTQRAIEELAFENEGIIVDGLNFQRDKDAMLNSLSMAIANHWFLWPTIKGLLFQVRHYRREEDKPGQTKYPQDIVMALAELAFLCRWLPEEVETAVRAARGNVRNRKFRTATLRRR